MKPQNTLDLGCGTGILTSMLVDKVGARGQAIGVDAVFSSAAFWQFRRSETLDALTKVINDIPKDATFLARWMLIGARLKG